MTATSQEPVLVDFRCPCCDRPVSGRRVTAHLKVTADLREPGNCQNCGRDIQLVEMTDDLGPSAYFARVQA